MKKLFSWLGLWKAKGEAKVSQEVKDQAIADIQLAASVETIMSSEVSQEAKDVISASEVFRNDLTEEEVAQARLKLNEVMKRLCSREE
jgi:hypothetical protein